MITKVTNSNSADYRALFEKATARVPGDIYNLDQYFALLQSLSTVPITEDKVNYIRLPLDEPPFEIDANTRNITVPFEFKTNGVSVKGDHYAEILYFTIDRYFDDVDFARDDLNIIIQWEDSEKGQGVSKAVFKDPYAFANQGKLLFGWALTNTITKVTGPLKFSVRIYKFGSAEEGTAAGLVYSFSTLTQAVNIMPALDYTITGTDQFEGIEAALSDQTQLLNRITGYTPEYVDTGTVPQPAQFTRYLGVITLGEDANGNTTITFGTPVTDSTHAKDADLVNNQLILGVQAQPSTTGNIFYNWHYFDKNNNDQSGTLHADTFYALTTDTVPSPDKLYYTKSAGVEGAYDVHSGSSLSGITLNEDPNTPYFEQYSKCAIVYNPAEGTEVTGKYYVNVNNVYTSTNGTANNAVVTSQPITILTPGYVKLYNNANHTVEYDGEDKHQIVPAADDTAVLQLYAGTLRNLANGTTVTSENDTVIAKFYELASDGTFDITEPIDEVSFITGVGSDSALQYTVELPDDEAKLALFNKKYKAIIYATRNGSSSTSVSETFQVSKAPAIPTVTLSGNTSFVSGGVAVTATIANADAIAHDEYSVKWYKVVGTVLDFTDDIEVTGATLENNVSTLTVTEPGKYYPVVTNTLNNATAVWQPSNAVSDVIEVVE